MDPVTGVAPGPNVAVALRFFAHVLSSPSMRCGGGLGSGRVERAYSGCAAGSHCPLQLSHCPRPAQGRGGIFIIVSLHYSSGNSARALPAMNAWFDRTPMTETLHAWKWQSRARDGLRANQGGENAGTRTNGRRRRRRRATETHARSSHRSCGLRRWTASRRGARGKFSQREWWRWRLQSGAVALTHWNRRQGLQQSVSSPRRPASSTLGGVPPVV